MRETSFLLGVLNVKRCKEKIFEFILNSPDIILEPSIGQGDLITFIIDKNPDIIFDMYEIDKPFLYFNYINYFSFIN